MNPVFGNALTSKSGYPKPTAAASEPKLEGRQETALDAAWAVLDAANDLGDDATIEVCRRVIDASLYQATPSPADLLIIFNYFR